MKTYLYVIDRLFQYKEKRAHDHIHIRLYKCLFLFRLYEGRKKKEKDVAILCTIYIMGLLTFD